MWNQSFDIGLISLNAPLFWVTSILAVVCLNPVTNTVARNWLLASINLGFLVLILKWQMPILIIGVVSVHLLLPFLRHSNYSNYALAVLALCLMYLFLINKGMFAKLTDAAIPHVLIVIGFSFVALRLVEIIRAVAEGRHEPPTLSSLINYILPFHMLAVGPIQSYDDFIAPQRLGDTKINDVLSAVERIAGGMFKKFVMAYAVKEAFLTDFQFGGFYFWFELQVFLIWLYLDFSAYSDIAVGVGRLMGVSTPENFNNPLFARNLIDFWERWHISLSQFIRRNLFIPIQLYLSRNFANQNVLLLSSIAIIISFGLCGLWHGISLGWLAWGALHGSGLAIVRVYSFYLQKYLGPEGMKLYRKNRVIRYIATFLTFEYVSFSLFPLFV